MASKFLVFFILISALLYSANGRKLLVTTENKPAPPPSFDGRLYLEALPKGQVHGSSPSKKGHAVTIDEKLIARHLAAIDRILRSVPSPGVGH